MRDRLPIDSRLRRAGHQLLALWGVALLLVAWQTWVTFTGLNSIVMPRPLDVFADVIRNPSIYAINASQTLGFAFAGLILGTLLGRVLAVLSWASRILTGLLAPVALLVSSIPVVALIPIIARLLGYNAHTVLAIVMLITFMPSFVLTSAGLKALPPGSGDLFRVLGAGKWTLLFRCALPAALPNAAIALRIAAPQAVLAAMLAEFLMGTSGLGYLFNESKASFDMERALGTSLVATFVSVLLFLIGLAIERKVRVFWT